MTFAEPLWLVGGAVACAGLLLAFRGADARRRKDLARFASASLIDRLTRSLSPARRSLKRVLLACGVAALAAALARPQWGFRWEEARRKGLDILFAVDTSKSMLAQDIKPDRLTRAKMAVEDLLEKLGGDRVGLIAFAGTAFLQCPMTCDYDAFRQSLEAIDVNIIPRGGTDIAGAIREAAAALEGKSGGERILILLTDGEDLEGRALETARDAAKDGLKIFAVGVGSSAGELVPVPDGKGGTEFARDAEGQFVKSRLDAAMLRQITEATGGLYEPLGTGGAGLESIYEKGLAAFVRHDVASRMHKIPLERFQWPLAAGLLCLVLEPLIGLRRRTASVPGAVRRARSGLLAAWNRLVRPAAVVAVVALLSSGRAFGSAQTGEKAYRDGQYSRAVDAYRKAAAKDPGRPVLDFNLGAAAYKAGDFDAAADAFAKALKTDDVKLQQDDYYNLGNARFRLGQRTEKSSVEQTLQQWEQAVQHYETALQLRPDDADARFNRDLVKQKIEEIKKQQPQNQQQSQQDQQQKDQQQQPQQDQQQPSQQNQPQPQQSQQDPQQDQKQKDQQQQDQQQQAQQPQPQKGEEKPKEENGQAKADRQPDPKGQPGEDRKEDQDKKTGQPVAQNPPPQEPKGEEGDAQRVPGEMSREEARQLLDSLKDNERRLPLAPHVRSGTPARENEPIKDW